MLGTIVKREFLNISSSRAMRIGTAVSMTLILIAGVVGHFLLGDDDGSAPTAKFTIGVEEHVAGIADQLNKSLVPLGEDAPKVEVLDAGTGVSWVKAEHDGESRLAVSGRIGALTFTQENADYEYEIVNQLVKQAAVSWAIEQTAGPLSPQTEMAVLQAQNPQVDVVDSDENLLIADPAGYMTGLAAQVLLIFAIIMGINSIASGVVEEKSSRVVEILLTTVRPRDLLLGKILGIGMFLLLQFALYVATALLSLYIAGLWGFVTLGPILAWGVVWLIVGFFLYTSLVGALAATVSRQEDLAAITTPMTFLILVPFYLGLFLVPAQPDALITKVLSVIPYFSSFMMPVRQGYGTVGTAEMLLALVLGLVTIPLVGRLSGRIYRNSILRTGKRVSLRQALKNEA
ncbi:MAG: ABC transporter permease [Trueperella sp.]|nr:ABC transporter permease [Trueperella sp.]